jgi:hypothetical protein
VCAVRQEVPRLLEGLERASSLQVRAPRGLAMIKDTINTAPRWFLTVWILVTTPLGATAGTLAFNLIMYKIAEIQAANGDSTKQAIADTNTRIGRLEVRMAVVESQMPPLVATVDEIRNDVKTLLKKRR